jgi:Winged helix DNA-binding domain
VNDRYSEEQIRQHLLSKQHLSPDNVGHDAAQIAEDLVGLHATAATSPYFQLLARMAHFKRDHLDRVLYEKRSIARVRCMRGTMFMVTKALLPMVMAATRRVVEPPSTRYLSTVGVTAQQFRRLAARIEQIFETTGQALSAAEIRRRLGADRSMSAVINLMCDQGRIVRCRPVGTWKSQAFTYRPFEEVFADIEPLQEAEAIVRLVERFLLAYGPVTPGDIVWWSGLGARQVRPALKQLEDVTVPVEVEGRSSKRLLHVDDHLALSKSDRGTVQPTINFLPELDPYLMGRLDRETMLDADRARYVTDRSGNVTSTIVVNGRVSGVWDITDAPSPTVRVHFFGRQPAGVSNAVRDCASRIGEFWFGGTVPIRRIPRMVPLGSRSAGSFLSPLRSPTED